MTDNREQRGKQVLGGALLIDKPVGWSSFKVVAVVRRILSQSTGKRVKVGHAGTLDPFASGLLLILVGEACKEAGRFLKLDKSYQVAACLGKMSTTGDPEGEVEFVSSRQPPEIEIIEALNSLQGHQLQKPPAYSAIKINGKRAYSLARKGEKVDLPARPIVVHSIELSSYAYPLVNFVCHVGSGTYIRSLVEDLGRKLETGAYTTGLRRLDIGDYRVDEALILSEDTPSGVLIDALQHLSPGSKL